MNRPRPLTPFADALEQWLASSGLRKRFDLAAGWIRSHRPIRADEPHVREGLLEDETSTMRVADDKHEIEIPVADLCHIGDGCSIHAICQPWMRAYVVGDGFNGEKGVRHSSSKSSAGEGSGDPAVNRDHRPSRP